MAAITIVQAYEQGSLRLAFQCTRPECSNRGGVYLGLRCGKIDIETAIKRWGGERRLDEIPARCGRCGSKDFVSVSSEPPGRNGRRGRR